MVGTTIKSFIIKTMDKLFSIAKKESNSLSMFVHIPKTAGTSFRASLEKTENVVCDYGTGKEHTSALVEEHIYVEQDTYALKQALSTQHTWLCGHMHLNKYLGIVSPQNIVTFVRDPLSRVISHYNHELRWGNNPNVTLEEFLKSNRAKNSQHRFLQGLPLSLIGFVGVTEQYASSLALLETEMSLKVEEEKFNQNTKKSSEEEDFTPEILSLIKEQNALDQAIYESAKAMLDERKILVEKNLPWTYIYAQITPNNIIRGIAFRRDTDEPVQLSVFLDGVEKSTLIASELTPLFPQAKFPRGRFVGFSYVLPKSLGQSPAIRLCVKATNQAFTIKH